LGADRSCPDIPRLRVGFLLDSLVVARWRELVISHVASAPFCEALLFAPVGASSGALERGRLRELARGGLYPLYERADRSHFGAANDALAPIAISRRDLRARLLDLPPSGAAPAGRHLTDPQIAAIRSHSLDVLLDLAAGAPARQHVSCARFGVWWFHQGDPCRDQSGPPLFPELFAPDPISVTALMALTEDGERMIYRSAARTDPVSLTRNRNATYWKTAHFAIRRLTDLHERGWDYIRSLPLYDERPLPQRRDWTAPTNREMMRFLGRLGRRMLRRRLRRLAYDDEWFIAYRRRDRALDGDRALVTFTKVPLPRRRFFADPFVVQYGDRHYVFFEELRRGKGVISYFEIDDQGRRSDPQLALEQDCHLSYPFLHREEGTVYMLPETRSKRTIELYRASRFPGEWTLEKVLLEGLAASDATLFRHGDRVWLFAAVALDGETPVDELCLFWSHSLLGEWRPHPMNPIVSDVRFARPAGRIFSHDGHLIRPAQDCSEAYGWRVTLNRIEVLNEAEYREVPIGSIEPDGSAGTLRAHTYNADGMYEVIDGCRLRSKLVSRTRIRAGGEPVLPSRRGDTGAYGQTMERFRFSLRSA
jgi:hypothetical protein